MNRVVGFSMHPEIENDRGMMMLAAGISTLSISIDPLEELLLFLKQQPRKPF